MSPRNIQCFRKSGLCLRPETGEPAWSFARQDAERLAHCEDPAADGGLWRERYARPVRLLYSRPVRLPRSLIPPTPHRPPFPPASAPRPLPSPRQSCRSRCPLGINKCVEITRSREGAAFSQYPENRGQVDRLSSPVQNSEGPNLQRPICQVFVWSSRILDSTSIF